MRGGYSGWLRLLAVLTLVTAAGCETPSGPKAVVGTYDMISFAGSSLPATVHASTGESMTVHNGELILTADERFNLRVERSLCITAEQCVEEVVTEEGSFGAGQGTLVLLIEGLSLIEGGFQGNQIVLYDWNPGSVWLRRGS